MADLNPRIMVEPGKMGGKPCIRGLRFTVYDLASYLASGLTEDEILRDFPDLEKEDFRAVYEFFASLRDGIAHPFQKRIDELAERRTKARFPTTNTWNMKL